MNVIELPTAIKRVRVTSRAKAAANRVNLTEDKVAALPARVKDYFVWDGEGRASVRGLHIHVQPTGTKTFRYSFRFPKAKQAISYKLGRWPGMSLEQARERATAAAKHVAKGVDPRNADPANSGTFEATVHVWHKREQVGRQKNITADSNRNFLLRICADLKQRPVADIKRQEISTILNRVVDSGRGPSANRTHAHLKSFFNWCVEEELVSLSPVKKRAPAPASQPRQRDWFTRKAADPVIKGLWDYASRIGGDRGKLLKLLLITGKRRNAVQKMTWEQIDDAWYWTPIKGTRSKRNNPITLPKLAQRVLGHRPDGGGSVFGICFHEGHINEMAEGLRKHVEPTYFHHGVRHVVTTKLAEMKVAPHVARLVMDHASMVDAHSGYEHMDWQAEMADALECWCRYIEGTIAAEGVSVLR